MKPEHLEACITNEEFKILSDDAYVIYGASIGVHSKRRIRISAATFRKEDIPVIMLILHDLYSKIEAET